MDAETKISLLSALETLRALTESAFEAQEMAWRTHAALIRLEIPGYQDNYQSASGISFRKMLEQREGILKRIDTDISRLQDSIP